MDVLENYCITEMMSVCSAEGLSEQELCRFFEWASHEKKCMYFVQEEFCDSLKAQIAFGKGE